MPANGPDWDLRRPQSAGESSGQTAPWRYVLSTLAPAKRCCSLGICLVSVLWQRPPSLGHQIRHLEAVLCRLLQPEDCCPLEICIRTGRPRQSLQCGDAFLEFVGVNLPVGPTHNNLGTNGAPQTQPPQVPEGDSTTAAPSQSLQCPTTPGCNSTRSHREQQRIALTKQVAPPERNSWQHKTTAEATLTGDPAQQEPCGRW